MRTLEFCGVQFLIYRNLQILFHHSRGLKLRLSTLNHRNPIHCPPPNGITANWISRLIESDWPGPDRTNINIYSNKFYFHVLWLLPKTRYQSLLKMTWTQPAFGQILNKGPLKRVKLATFSNFLIDLFISLELIVFSLKTLIPCNYFFHFGCSKSF